MLGVSPLEFVDFIQNPDVDVKPDLYLDEQFDHGHQVELYYQILTRTFHNDIVVPIPYAN